MRICSNHQEYKVPLIWTFAFPGAEYWCPYCGHQHGMLGAGESPEEIEEKELKKRGEKYEDFSKEFLHASGTLCCAQTKFKGEWIKPGELPEEEKKRLKKIREEWKYNQKIEEVKK